MKRIIAACLLAWSPLSGAWAHSPTQGHGAVVSPGFGRGARITQVYEHPLPNLPGRSIKGVLVEYAPGGGSPAHTHPPSALIYATVLQGSVRMRFNGGPVQIFTQGQNFTERPGDRHDLSENASDTEPAAILAVFVVETNDLPLITPIQR